MKKLQFQKEAVALGAYFEQEVGWSISSEILRECPDCGNTTSYSHKFCFMCGSKMGKRVVQDDGIEDLRMGLVKVFGKT